MGSSRKPFTASLMSSFPSTNVTGGFVAECCDWFYRILACRLSVCMHFVTHFLRQRRNGVSDYFLLVFPLVPLSWQCWFSEGSIFSIITSSAFEMRYGGLRIGVKWYFLEEFAHSKDICCPWIAPGSKNCMLYAQKVWPQYFNGHWFVHILLFASGFNVIWLILHRSCSRIQKKRLGYPSFGASSPFMISITLVKCLVVLK